MTDQTVKELVARYTDLFEGVKRMRRELRAAEYALESIKTTIHLFEPAYPIGDIKARKLRVDAGPQTERNRSVMEILRRSDVPISSRELAKAVLRKEGNTTPTNPVLDHVAANLHRFLTRQRSRGFVRVASRAPVTFMIILPDVRGIKDVRFSDLVQIAANTPSTGATPDEPARR